MSCLSSCHHHHIITLASLTNNTSSSSSSPETNHKPNPPITRRTKLQKNQKPLNLSSKLHPNISEQKKQLAIMEMERAIGAGTFRDNEPRHCPFNFSCFAIFLIQYIKYNMIVFNGVLPDLSGVFEGPVEKKIRETGQWVATNTEQKIRSSNLSCIDFAGKGILIVSMQWILPIWTLLLLLASGAVKLPFSIPLLDDLIL
ncbi:hypothetical protein JRO89_XS05G0225700 [Xanthoceras sorbifolium]|uniref:Chlororespiratory reduction 3 n=1 Tax=Xanthoceras sorbifolium TaxID=99658 RepID=A0ABQ8I2R7_9ROSI|nr:hypothetical protein JRO89_XS05G0225700 [Xanthoceras sorbifolium]